jgi:hypothetical protein
MTSVWPASAAVEAAVGAVGDHEQSMLALVIAAVCGVWALAVVLVQTIGFTQLYAG